MANDKFFVPSVLLYNIFIFIFFYLFQGEGGGWTRRDYAQFLLLTASRMLSEPYVLVLDRIWVGQKQGPLLDDLSDFLLSYIIISLYNFMDFVFVWFGDHSKRFSDTSGMCLGGV